MGDKLIALTWNSHKEVFFKALEAFRVKVCNKNLFEVPLPRIYSFH